MSVIAAAVRELIAAGVTGDALVTAIERLEADLVASIEAEAFAADRARKAAAAERQARYVKRRHLTSDDVKTPEMTSVTSAAYREEDKKERKISKKVSIPENWLPNENGLALARQQGLDEQKIKLEIHRFEDYAKQHDRRYVDWQAAWRNWVTSPFQQKANGNGNGNRRLQDDRLSVSKAAERLAERNVEFPPRPSLVSGTGTPHRRLLPER